MFYSCHSRATSRFKESRISLGHGMDVKREFKREVESDSNELLGLSNQGFSKEEKIMRPGIPSSVLTILKLRFLLDINK